MPSRTPPELKWLLVERATLLGDIEQLARRRAELDTELQRLQSLVMALDTSIRLLDARVRAEAAGKVFRHCQQYGKRGALKTFITQTLREAEEGLSLRAIAERAARHFSLDVCSSPALTRYGDNSIRPQLQQLRDEGLVENLPGTGRVALLWRWKRSVPTFADLALLAGVTLAGEVPDGHQNASGHQMAHQRDGHAAG